MRNKLRLLYGLQKIDSELDELLDLRGDLPEKVSQLQTKVQTLTSSIAELENFLKQGTVDRDWKEKETFVLLEKIDKYKAQQLKVRTNKEYDALTKEIDTASATIKKYEEEIEAHASLVQEKKDQKEELSAQLEILKEDLHENEKELKEILASTAKEEKGLMTQRGKILHLISADDLQSYTRIREAKKGKTVMPIKRGSCSGCFNIVPPQLILQIKMNDKIYLCEHCGRILISEELSKDNSPLL